MADTISLDADGAGRAGRAPASLIVFTVLVCSGAIFLVAQHTILARPPPLQWAPWAYSEWLISYQAGFVRRGLVGTIIRSAGAGSDLLFITNWIVFTAYAALVAALAIMICTVERHALRGALALLMPGSIIQMAITNEMYYRKEIVFHLFIGLTGICVLWFKNSVNSPTIGRAIAVISLIPPFISEIFLFTTLPATLILIYLLLAQTRPEKFKPLALCLVAAHLVLFAGLSVFKGGGDMARTIWLSLPLPDRLMIDPAAPDHPAGGISAIGHSVAIGLKGPLWLLATGFSWYWILVGGAIFWLLWRLFPPHRGISILGHALAPQSAVFLGALPLFFLGWDWGRWLSCAVISALVVHYADGRSAPPTAAMLRRLDKRVEILLLLALFGAAFFTRMPECCLTGSGEPAYINIRDLIRQWR